MGNPWFLVDLVDLHKVWLQEEDKVDISFTTSLGADFALDCWLPQKGFFKLGERGGADNFLTGFPKKLSNDDWRCPLYDSSKWQTDGVVQIVSLLRFRDALLFVAFGMGAQNNSISLVGCLDAFVTFERRAQMYRLVPTRVRENSFCCPLVLSRRTEDKPMFPQKMMMMIMTKFASICWMGNLGRSTHSFFLMGRGDPKLRQGRIEWAGRRFEFWRALEQTMGA